MESSSKTGAGTTSAPRRRGRPPNAELAARRRSELIEAAYHVFAERGYHAAGIADIAERLQIGHGTFYRYFESKRDILDHVVDYGIERLSEAVREEVTLESVETIEELGDQIRRIVDRVLEVLEAEPGLGQVILLEATSIDEEMTLRLLGLADTMALMTAGYIEEGVKRGLIRKDIDVELTAQGVNSLLVPIFLKAVQGSLGADERRRYADALLAFAAHGLQAPASES